MTKRENDQIAVLAYLLTALLLQAIKLQENSSKRRSRKYEGVMAKKLLQHLEAHCIRNDRLLRQAGVPGLARYFELLEGVFRSNADLKQDPLGRIIWKTMILRRQKVQERDSLISLPHTPYSF